MAAPDTGALGGAGSLVSGAVVSGAYFGDKLSPISDMTNIAAIGAGANLYRHIGHMMPTSLPPAVIALIAYALLVMVLLIYSPSGILGWVERRTADARTRRASFARQAAVPTYDAGSAS